jgi:hypothetical protein
VGSSREARRHDDQYAVEIAVDLIVPEAQHAKSVAQQTAITRLITRCMLIEIVLPSIDFHDEFLCHADEVDDVASAR